MNKKTFGELLRERRKALKLTAEKLAEKIGIDRTYLSKIEKHNKLPSDDVFYKLKERLEMAAEFEQLYLSEKHPRSTIISSIATPKKKKK